MSDQTAAPTTAAPTTAAPTTAAPRAPTSYEAFTPPKDAEVKPFVAGAVVELAKSLDLPQAEAQKLFDASVGITQKFAEAQAAEVASIHAGWAEQMKTDPDLAAGGNLDANLAKAKAAMEKTCTPQMRTLLERSGLGNHPDVVKHFLTIAPSVLPDTFAPGGAPPSGGQQTLAQRLYGQAA